MTRTLHGLTMSLCMAAAACGGSKTQNPPKNAASPGTVAADANAQFGPLGVGADWQSYAKVNSTPARSQDHGGRFVDTYVNAVGAEAYKDESKELPVGTIIVKTSWEAENGQPSTRPGPIFVMEKKEPGYDAANGDWYYAIHWENPTEPFQKKLGGPIYWQSPSPKVGYCVNCHSGYDRQLGMVPEENRAW